MIKIKIIRLIKFVINALFLGVLFIIPVYFSIVPPTYNVFELGKIFIFRSLVVLLFFLTALRLFLQFNDFKPLAGKLKNIFSGLSKFDLIPLVFIIGLGLSWLFSSNFLQSFFGSYDRQAGYLSYIYYFVFFILLVVNLIWDKNEEGNDQGSQFNKKIVRIFWVITLSGLTVSAYAILQRLGIDFLIWSEAPRLTGRSFSSLGQPNFLASWLLLVIPLSAYLFFHSSLKLERIFCLVIFVIEIAALFTSGSRGGIIAFCLSVVFFFVYLLFYKKKINKRLVFGLASLIILGIGLFFVINNQVDSRWQALLDFKTGSLAARIDFYKASLDAIITRPLSGYGLDNLSDVFIERYQPDWGIHSNIAVINDKAHNFLLDWLLSGGIIGLVFWVALYYYFFNLALEIERRRRDWLAASLAFGVGVYLLSLFFNFSFVSGELYVFSFLGILLAIKIYSKQDFSPRPDKYLKLTTKTPLINFIILLLIAVISVFLFFYEISNLRADNYFLKMRYRLLSVDYYGANYFLDKIESLKINPVNKEYYRRVAADILSENCLSLDSNSNSHCLDRLAYLDKYLSNNNIENIFVKGKIKSVLGEYDEAKKYLDDISQRAPYWPKSYIELGRLYFRSGDFKRALAYYELAWAILPDSHDIRFNDEHREFLRSYYKLILKEKGDLFFSFGDIEAARKEYLQAYEINSGDGILLKKIINTYYLQGRFDVALDYVLQGEALFPADYSWLFQAAILLKDHGNFIGALEYVERAEKLAPEDDNLLQFKQELLNL